MLAVELARLARFRKIILISSAKTCLEIPFYFRKAGKAGWHRWITADRLVRMRQKISPLMNRLGAEYRLFSQMVSEVDQRWEERRLGKEGVSTCRSGWLRCNSKKKKERQN